MSKLFSPFTLRGVTIRNRIMMSPMCMYSSADGFANEWHLVHLGSRAVGGAGLIMTEATAVSPEGRISPDDLGIWKDEHIPGLQQLTAFISAHGAVPAIQLAHAGRKASHSSEWKGSRFLEPGEGGWQTVGPSAIAFSPGTGIPVALDRNGIEQVQQDFAVAAERAVRAGFRVIEIHAAHGYLVHQFLSPLSNTRADEYGGVFQNRIRLLLEIVERIRAAVPGDLPLIVRLSCTDWAEGGWNPEEATALAKVLKDKNVDMIDCSSGGLIPGVRIPLGPGYQVPFAEQVRKEAGIPTGAVGLITTARQAEEILEQGRADLVIFGRQLLRDPYFPFHAAKELGEDIPWPDPYRRAKN